MKFHLTLRSSNAKTSPIPVSTSSKETCPDACPLNKSNICYAKTGPLGIHWSKVSKDERGLDWPEFLDNIRALPEGQLWRHNQAGDLPGLGDELDVPMLEQLVEANEGKNGFTYTHKPLRNDIERQAIARSNERGFTINLSADDVSEVDELVELRVGPVVTVLPHDFQGNSFVTPGGNRGVVCPAQTGGVNCQQCQLCYKVDRKSVVGFIQHGINKKKKVA